MPPSSNTHSFFDVRMGAFYLDTHLDTYGPTAVLNYQTEITEHRHAIIGGRDGYVRYYDDRFDTDDGWPVTSYVFMPPFLVGDDHREGIILELIAALAQGSADVDYDLHVGRSHEEALLSDAFVSGSWTGEGLHHSTRMRVRGFSAFLKISNGEYLRWAIEDIVAVVRVAGRVRIP
jgi:hypothetical protein